MNLSNKLNQLPQYLFAQIDELKQQVLKKGVDLIDLGIGDPDLPTPPHIIKSLKTAIDNPKNHQYPSYNGLLRFRQAVANWYKNRFNVELNPVNEVISLIGSKEGIAHIPLAFVNPNDVVLVPLPGYPVYQNSTILSEGQPYILPLRSQNGFLPDLTKIPSDVLKRTKLLFLNYPNNPTSAVCSIDFFKQIVEFATKHQIIVCHDAAYSEIYFDGQKPHSFLEIDGAKDIGIEFHSLSKTYNMTGWRIGFAVGNSEILKGLLKVKTNIDSGVFQAIQEAGITALEDNQDCVHEMRKIYQERRDVLVQGLKGCGFELTAPQATFYLWIPVLKGYSSTQLSLFLLEKTGIVVTPGIGFGQTGFEDEEYIRIALTVDKERLKEVVDRIKLYMP